MMLEETEDPIERFVEFIVERESIRLLRSVNADWPWTTNPILQTYRFTNIRREDDKVSKHYQKIVRDVYLNDPLVLPATAIYRWFNRPSTCGPIFDIYFGNASVFEEYMENHDLSILQDLIKQLPVPHVTGAYIITGMPGYTKAQGVLQYIDRWCQKPWREQWDQWQENPPLLSEMYDWVNSDGLGSFMRGQLVADLKYLPFMNTVADWWTWATPGPGSMRGLNVVLGRGMNTPWMKGEWHSALMRLSEIVELELAQRGITKLHNQDLQNCLCEFSKYTKVVRGMGRPRQVFRHV